MKNIICIVGRTNCGKDMLAGKIKSQCGIEPIVSYTTRPMRDYEVNGVHHWFVSQDEMGELLANKTIIAYTINDETGIEYCATLESIPGDTCVYIINPDGIRWLEEHTDPKECRLFIVELWAEDSVLEERAKLRGDNMDAFRKRLSSESEEFVKFHYSNRAHLKIDATKTPDEVFAIFLKAWASFVS